MGIRSCFENNYHIKPSWCVRHRNRQNLNFGVFPQKSLFLGILVFWAFLAILADPPIFPIFPILAILPIFAKT